MIILVEVVIKVHCPITMKDLSTRTKIKNNDYTHLHTVHSGTFSKSQNKFSLLTVRCTNSDPASGETPRVVIPLRVYWMSGGLERFQSL